MGGASGVCAAERPVAEEQLVVKVRWTGVRKVIKRTWYEADKHHRIRTVNETFL